MLHLMAQLTKQKYEYLAEFSLKNKFACLNTKFQKMNGNLWANINPNNFKAKLNDIFISKKHLF